MTRSLLLGAAILGAAGAVGLALWVMPRRTSAGLGLETSVSYVQAPARLPWSVPGSEVGRRPVDPFDLTSTAGAFVLTVVDGHDGLAVPGAEVTYADVSERELHEAISDPALLEQLLLDQGRPTRTDRSGRSVLPHSSGLGLVAARATNRYGLSTVRNASEVRLELFPDFDLVVDVSDHTGRPAAEAEILLTADRNVAARAVTGADGRATIPHAGWRMAHRKARSWSVGLVGMFRKAVRVELTGNSVSGRTVRLQRPPISAAVVSLENLGGGAYAHPVEVELQGFDERDGKNSRRRLGRLRRRAVGGSVRFEAIEVGISLRASAVLRHIRLTATGPVVQAEQVSEIELGFDDQRTYVTGRALDSGGKPLRSTHLRLAWEGDWDDATNFTRRLAWTDQRGIFVVALGTEIPACEGLRAIALGSPGRNQEPPRLDLRAALAPGAHDVGDVRLVRRR